MSQHKVLMIDDDPKSIERVRLYLDSRMYSFCAINDPFEAIDKATEICPDIIILDIDMPEMRGYDVCKRLRSYDATREIPIIIYSVHGDEDDAFVYSMNLGVHAVLEKLEKGNLGRLAATIERFTKQEYAQGKELKILRNQGHELKIQGEANRVWLDGGERFLRPKTRKILAYLASQPGVLVSSEELVSITYSGEDIYHRTPEDIHRLVHDLRDCIEPNPKAPIFIESKRRVGYRLIEENIAI